MPPASGQNLLPGNAVIIKVKALAALTALHDAQRLTRLRMIGLMFNVRTLRLTDGLRRRIV